MIYKTESMIPGHVCIIFELPSSVWAHRVSLQGEFNNWDGQGEPLYQDRDGYWRTSLDLPLNCQFEFHYLVDGNELLDRNADGLSQGSFHEQKSIVSTTLSEPSALPQHRNRAIVTHHETSHTASNLNAEQPNIVPA